MTYTLFRLFRFVVTYLWRLVWAVIWPVAEPAATAIAKRSPVDFNLFYGHHEESPLRVYRICTGGYSIEWAFITLEFFCPDEWDGRVSRALGLAPPAQC